SHILPELAEMVDEIGVIENGTLIAEGRVSDIQQRMRANRVLHIRMLNRDHEAAEWLKDQPNVAAVQRVENGLAVHFDGDDESQWELLRRLIAADYKLVSFSEEPADLEDVFLEITKGARS